MSFFPLTISKCTKSAFLRRELTCNWILLKLKSTWSIFEFIASIGAIKKIDTYFTQLIKMPCSVLCINCRYQGMKNKSGWICSYSKLWKWATILYLWKYRYTFRTVNKCARCMRSNGQIVAQFRSIRVKQFKSKWISFSNFHSLGNTSFEIFHII